MESPKFSKKLTHVAIAVKDLQKTIKRLEALGIGPFKPYDFDVIPPLAGKLYFHGKPLEGAKKGGNVNLYIGKMGNVSLEIFEPIDAPSPQQEFMDKRGEGIHHIAFTVDDFEKELSNLTEKGAEILQIARLENNCGACYLDMGIADLVFELEKLS
jgi:methylmalonyl-CoA/ethylmalonyl-CoA epimerase